MTKLILKENKMDKIKYFIIAMAFSFFISGCSSIRPDPGQSVFASSDEATAALKDAVKKNDTKRLMEIFGSDGKDIVFSGDEKFDVDSREWFAKKADEKMDVVRDDDVFLLKLGNDEWLFPVPLAQYDGKWFFHTAAGLDEMLNRRIGRNELNAINVCRAIVDAQEEFARIKAAAGGQKEYALRFISEKGKFNGLYWDDEGAKDKSPVGARIVLASHETPFEQPRPYHGYNYVLLTAQGADAPGGAKSYLVNGKMSAGFAIAAYPASYGVSGIKTFIVSKSGIVFEKDLGNDTAKTIQDMVQFNPDDTWIPVRD